MTRWMVLDATAFRVVDFDDGAVLYDRRSGQSHILNGMAAEAFAVLSETALTKDQLAGRLIEAIEGEPQCDADRAAEVIIRRLDALGVIDRVDG